MIRWRTAAVAMLVGAPSAAVAGDVASLGLSVGLVGDLRDRASQGETRLSPGVSVAVPLRLSVLDALRVRADLHFSTAWGDDQLTWTRTVGDSSVRLQDAGSQTAYVGVLGLSVGIEAHVPVKGAVRPYGYATVGVAGVGVYHALRGETAELLDPAQNEIGNPRNLDPYTLQAALEAGAGLGVSARVSRKVEVWFETGYSGAFVGPATLRKTAPSAEARREAFAWNPLRASVGVVFPL